MIVVTLIISYNKTQKSNLTGFKDTLIKKYTFIDKIEISRVGPNLAINIQMKDNVRFENIEDVFNEIINQPQAVFDDINKIDKKRAGYIEQLYIGFLSIKDTSTDNYLFYSISRDKNKKGFERFEKWTIEHNGVQKIYVPEKE